MQHGAVFAKSACCSGVDDLTRIHLAHLEQDSIAVFALSGAIKEPGQVVDRIDPGKDMDVDAGPFLENRSQNGIRFGRSLFSGK